MFTTTQDLALMNETAVFDGNFIDYYKMDKNCGFIDYERRILFYYWPGPSTREQTYTNRILLDFAK